MGKRGAAQAAGAKAKVRKTPAKETQEVVIEARQEEEECSPVVELLALAQDLPESCRQMLGAMAPHSLRTPEGERHPYQEQMIGVLTTVFTGVEDERKAAVATTEEQIAEAEKECEGASAAVVTATEKEAAETSARDAKVAANAEAEQAAAAAQEALAAAQDKVASFESEQKAVAEEKAEYEKLAGEKMAQLKAGGFPGKEWRVRDKIIGEVQKALEALSPDESSLRDALGVALRAKPGQRGGFAEKAIEFTEALLAKHITELAERLASGEAEAARRATAVSTCEEELKVAQQKRDESQDEYIAAENSLLEATESKKAAQQALDAFAPRMAKLSKELAAAKERLEGVQALAAKFEVLRVPPPPPAEVEEKLACTEEPAAKEAMAVEEAPVVAA